MIRLVRRLVLAPLVIALTALIWLTLPLWLIAAAFLAPMLPGRMRPLRVLWIFILYLTAESLLLLVTDRTAKDTESTSFTLVALEPAP